MIIPSQQSPKRNSFFLPWNPTFNTRENAFVIRCDTHTHTRTIHINSKHMEPTLIMLYSLVIYKEERIWPLYESRTLTPPFSIWRHTGLLVNYIWKGLKGCILVCVGRFFNKNVKWIGFLLVSLFFSLFFFFIFDCKKKKIQPENMSLFVGRLPTHNFDDRDLEDIFYKYGRIINCQLKRGSRFGKYTMGFFLFVWKS